MNILLVSSYLPYPLFSGGHIRLYNLIKELSKSHNITLICEKRDYQGDAEIKELEKFCRKVIAVARRKQWTIKNILKTGLSLSPFLIIGHASLEMKREIKRELNENQFNLIHAETSYIMQNIPSTNLPIVLTEHNVEYLVYKRFAETVPLPLKPFLCIDVLKLKYWEEKMWHKAKKLIAVSEFEKKIMSKIRQDVTIVSNGVDIAKFKIHPFGKLRTKFKITGGEKTVLFIGEFRWVQNRNSAEFILKEIWPKLKEKFISPTNSRWIKLWIVGKNIPSSIRKITTDRDVIFDENAPKNTEEIFAKSTLLLAPIKVGGGTSYKILEAMASGVPVITTPLGNAINAKENSEIVLAQSAQDFAVSIKKLLSDEEFYKTISVNARKLVEEKFNWQKIAQDLNSVYESIAV